MSNTHHHRLIFTFPNTYCSIHFTAKVFFISSVQIYSLEVAKWSWKNMGRRWKISILVTMHTDAEIHVHISWHRAFNNISLII